MNRNRLAAVLALLPLAPLHAEPPDDDLEALVERTKVVSQTTSRVIVPVPLAGPQIGAGVAVGAVWFYTPTGSLRPWTTGGAGLVSSNGSWGVGGRHSMTLGGDRIRMDVTVAHGSFNTQFFGVGGNAGQASESIGINQTPSLVQGQATMQVFNNLFVGPRLRYLDMQTEVRDPTEVPPGFDIADIEEQRRVVAVGPVISFDRTDGSLNPRSGTTINGQWLFSLTAMGSTADYNKANLTVNHYVDVDAATVVGFRGSLCAASADAPFFDLCLFGSSANLRGYPNGQFRDRASWAVQTEWRRRLGGRWGVVAFAGIGGIAPGLGEIGRSTLLPAAGGGVRFEVSAEYRVNVRLDAAVGRDSQALYLSLGEAF